MVSTSKNIKDNIPPVYRLKIENNDLKQKMKELQRRMQKKNEKIAMLEEELKKYQS